MAKIRAGCEFDVDVEGVTLKDLENKALALASRYFDLPVEQLEVQPFAATREAYLLNDGTVYGYTSTKAFVTVQRKADYTQPTVSFIPDNAQEEPPVGSIITAYGREWHRIQEDWKYGWWPVRPIGNEKAATWDTYLRHAGDLHVHPTP